MYKRTKIIATISDKRCEVEFIRQLFEAGMNIVRFNTAHMDITNAKKMVENIRNVSDKIAILLDTKGPEIRTSAYGKEVSVKTGDIIKVIGNPEEQSGGDTIYVSYPNIFNDVEIGNLLLVDDGEIEFRIIEKKEKQLICQATNPGIIKLRKGVNIPDVAVNLPALSEKDLKFINFAIDENIDFIAHSFVRTAKDVIDIKNILKAKGSNIKIIAKIENQQGIDNIEEILDHTYGIMVARGDLGIEIPAEKIPATQRFLISKCQASKKPVIIATQMLHTMIEHPRPTRAEVSDVAGAIYQRADAIMLSGETATGLYPVEAVKKMSNIAHEVEQHLNSNKDLNLTRVKNPICATIAHAAVDALETLPIKAIVLDTLTGRTGRYISAFRGKVPVYVMCYDKTVMRQMALSYGITAYFVKYHEGREDFLKNTISLLVNEEKIEEEDLILAVGGSFGVNNGASFIEISNAKTLRLSHLF